MQNQKRMWEKINVWQYQQIYNLYNSKDNYTTDIEVDSKLVSIVNDITEAQVDSLPLSEFNKLKESIKFLTEPIVGKPVKYIKISKSKRYKINYDVSKMPFARYIESKVFSEDLYGNLHKLAATMVIPQKKRYGFWVTEKYDASKHEQYSDDMLTARFIDDCQTLYELFKKTIHISSYITGGYLTAKFLDFGTFAIKFGTF